MSLKKRGVFLTIYILSIGLSFYFGKNAGLVTHATTNQMTAAETPGKSSQIQTLNESQKSGKNTANIIQPDSKKVISSTDDEQESTDENSNMIAYETCQQIVLAKEQTRQVREFVSRANSENVSARDLADDKFEQETINHQWATDKERAIYRALDNEDGLRNITPLSITCRSQNCRVVMSYDDQIQAQQLSNQFNEALSKENKSITWLVDEPLGELVFYMGSDASLFQ